MCYTISDLNMMMISLNTGGDLSTKEIMCSKICMKIL